MVLEGVEIDSTSTTYDTPYSSPDPYDTNDTPNGDTTIIERNLDLSKLPRPFFLGRPFGYNEQFLIKRLRNTLRGFVQLVNRTPTEEEFNAFAYHQAKITRILSFGAPAGIASGFWRAYETRAEFKWPFRKPNPNEPEVWSTVRINGRNVLSGQAARLFWQTLRWSAYGGLGYVIVGTFFSSYALVTGSVGMLQDPRLADYAGALRKQAETERQKLNEQHGLTKKKEKRDPTGQGQKPASELWKEHRRSINADETRQRSSSYDDASPTAVGFDDGDAYASPAVTEPKPQEPTHTSPSSYSTASYPQIGVPPSQRIPQSTRPRAPHQAPGPPPQEGLDFDDPSPVTPSSERSQSAWARIRSERMSSSTPSPQRRTRRPSTSESRSSEESSFEFEGEDKERAQKEFDERVERRGRAATFPEAIVGTAAIEDGGEGKG